MNFIGRSNRARSSLAGKREVPARSYLRCQEKVCKLQIIIIIIKIYKDSEEDWERKLKEERVLCRLIFMLMRL